MNRAHTRKQIDISKPLILVESAEEFFHKENEEGGEITTNDKAPNVNELKRKGTALAEGNQESSNIPAPAIKKQEIIIPVAKQVEEPKALPDFDDVLFKKRKFQTHYIRINYCQAQPNPEVYELSDKDLQFIKELNEKIPKNPKNNNDITPQLFSKTIELWENTTEKNDTISPQKAQNVADSLYPPPTKEFIPKVYEYWKGLRDNYQRPLLRKYWRVVNKDENNPNAAFRTREVTKIKTRRAQRVNESENLEKMKALRQDLDMAITLLANIRYREMLKLELTDLSILRFENSLKEKPDHAKPMEKFKETYENEPYVKLKNKLKEYNNTASRLINQFKLEPKEPEYEKPIIPPPKPLGKMPTMTTTVPTGNGPEELNFDLGSFIASIIDEAHNKDITPIAVQKLMQPAAGEEVKANGVEMMIEKPPDLEKMPSFKKLAPFESMPPAQPSPTTDLLSTPLRRGSSQIQPKPPKPIIQTQQQQQQPLLDEKNIFRYRIRKRIGRGGRVLLDRVFEEDENSTIFTHHKDFYAAPPIQKEVLIIPEVAQKLRSANLHQLYWARFEKFKDICPFNDSEEGETDMTESTKMIKNLGANFKNFMKQRRPTNPVI